MFFSQYNKDMTLSPELCDNNFVSSTGVPPCYECTGNSFAVNSTYCQQCPANTLALRIENPLNTDCNSKLRDHHHAFSPNVTGSHKMVDKSHFGTIEIYIVKIIVVKKMIVVSAKIKKLW